MNSIPYLPEGYSGKHIIPVQMEDLKKAVSTGQVMEGLVTRCDSFRNLFVSFGIHMGMIPFSETCIGAKEGNVKDIAVISLVGKPVCFKVIAINEKSSPPLILLSRRLAQMESLDYFMNRTREGDVLPAVITHLAQFGAFADIGCGIISMIGIENISVARIFHPSERFSVGQKIYAVVSSIDRTKKRVTLTHKELLGTWQQNASKFSAGDTVTGIIRSIKPYGLFIELTPNLSGLSEYNDKYITGDTVSVYIKSITSEKMKIKLSIIGRVCDSPFPSPFEYFLPGEHIDRWVYSPPGCEKIIETVFIPS
jgi:small subunit ribosomal protein S1